MQTIYTIGHSTHASERFVELLTTHHVTAIGDVRSSPYSTFNPQFNRETLRDSLAEEGIAYVFLGDELGARRSEPECYDDGGRVDYGAVARSDLFVSGIDRVRRGINRYRLALMCAERDPLDCHRTILVCRNLRGPGTEIRHILADGTMERHAATERRLLTKMRLPEGDLFTDPAVSVERAYEMRGRAVAYVRPEPGDSP